MVYQIVTSNRRAWAFAVGLLAVGAACSGAPKPDAPHPSPPPAPREASSAPPPAATSVPRPDHPLTIDEARRYMLALVNRDRAKEGLRPVELESGAAMKAGQAHVEDMVRLGYLGHWGSDGSVPESRYTEAGGTDAVFENALCFTDLKKRSVDPSPRIAPEQVEKAESSFFDEVPPNDGHRKNILRPAHTHLGIGVAQSAATPTELAVPCFTHEFVDAYGTIEPLPKHAKAGSTLHVAGTLSGGAIPSGVGIAKLPLAKPITPSELNTRRTYPVPKPAVMYWGPGFVTPKPVTIDGPRFAIDIPLGEPNEAALYEISVWAKINGEQSIVSLRTIVSDR